MRLCFHFFFCFSCFVFLWTHCFVCNRYMIHFVYYYITILNKKQKKDILFFQLQKFLWIFILNLCRSAPPEKVKNHWFTASNELNMHTVNMSPPQKGTQAKIQTQDFSTMRQKCKPQFHCTIGQTTIVLTTKIDCTVFDLGWVKYVANYGPSRGLVWPTAFTWLSILFWVFFL